MTQAGVACEPLLRGAVVREARVIAAARLQLVHQSVERVGRGQHADDLAPLDHHGATDATGGHGAGHIGEGRLGRHRVGLEGHHVLDDHCGVELGKLDHELYVALAHHPDQLAAVQHRQVVNAVGAHALQGIGGRLLGTDGQR